MRLVVTGASGFIGRPLVSRLAEVGHSGLAISRKCLEGLPAGWRWVQREEALALPLREGDFKRAREPVGSVDSLDPHRKNRRMPYSDWPAVDALIHLEVKQHVQNPNASDRVEFERVNVGGTREWLNWCERHDVSKFMLFSSIKSVAPADKCQSEEAAPCKDSPYGRSKWRAERLVTEWVEAAGDRSAVIFRPAVVYGPGNTANISALMDAIYRGRFFLVGRNENVKSIVSLENLIGAVLFCLQRQAPGLQVYNVVDEPSYSVCELARMIAEALNVRWKPRSIPLPLAWLMAGAGTAVSAVVGREVALTRSRLKSLLETSQFSSGKLMSAGFRPPQSTREGLAKLAGWYLGSKHPASSKNTDNSVRASHPSSLLSAQATPME